MIWQKYREFANLEGCTLHHLRKGPESPGAFVQIPYTTEQGIFETEQGIKTAISGNFSHGTEKLASQAFPDRRNASAGRLVVYE